MRLGLTGDAKKITVGGVSTFSAPAVTPAYLGVGFIIGPELGALNFAGGLLAWGLFVPLLVFFLGPSMIDQYTDADGVQNWAGLVAHLYRFIVRPIAVGGMLVGACYTLYRMRARLAAGLKRSIADVKKSATAAAATERTEQRPVLQGRAARHLRHRLRHGGALLPVHATPWLPAIFAALVMLVTGFFFAAVSGNLVGTIGSSNNPLSGLTLATTIVAALTMVIVGAKGDAGRRGGAGRGGDRLRLGGRRRRDAAGPQGRAHPRRYPLEDAGRRHHRRGRRGPRRCSSRST